MPFSSQLYKMLGERIRRFRERSKLTQDELAQRVELTRTSITNIESGRQKIQIHTLYRLADCLGVSPLALLPNLGEEDDSPIDPNIMASLAPAEAKWVNQVIRGKGG